MLIVEGRFIEIIEKLGPTLREMGLEATLKQSEEGATVSFLPAQGETYFSPIEIDFENWDKNPPSYYDEDFPEPAHDASWDHAYIVQHNFKCRRLGDTGFEHWGDFERESWRVTKRRGDKLYEWLSNIIASHDLVPTGGVTPNCIASYNFANAYTVIARKFPDIGVAQETFETQPPIEILTFSDPLGRRVEVSMQVGDALATVQIEGEDIMSFEQKDLRSFHHLALDLSKLEPENCPGL